MDNHWVQKCSFLGSILIIPGTLLAAFVAPSLILYSWSLIFVIFSIIRGFNYWENKYILFLLDPCYFANLFSLILVWIFPKCQKLQIFQFGLANSLAYGGSFFFMNAFVLHDHQKMFSCFIHVLPGLFSYLIRWFPTQTSMWWYSDFVNSTASTKLLDWNQDIDWLWLYCLPLTFEIIRVTLYLGIVYGLIKPSNKHLDSFRYLRKNALFRRILWDRFNERWHYLLYILCDFFIGLVELLLAVLAWSSILIHILMLLIQFVAMTWNGAIYYVDSYPSYLIRHLVVGSKNPNDSGHADPEKSALRVEVVEPGTDTKIEQNYHHYPYLPANRLDQKSNKNHTEVSYVMPNHQV